MTVVNLSAAIFKVYKLQSQEPNAYDVCLQRFLQLPHTPARNLSNVIYALCLAPAAIRQQHTAALQQQLVPAFVAECADASAQGISNVLYGMADSGQQLPQEAVQQLLAVFVSRRVLLRAEPQNVSNSLWAAAKLDQQVPSEQLQRMLDAFVDMLQQCKPQNVSNTLWAVATMGQQVPPEQLQQMLDAFVDMLQQAKPQEVSNTLWAVATMRQQVPDAQLQQMFDTLVGKLQHAKPQEVSNTLLACAKLCVFPQQLLAAPGLAGLLRAGDPQGLANAAWACGQLGHRDEQLMGALLAEVQQRLAAAAVGDGRSSFTTQGLCNLCWAVAVLDLQQHAQQVLQLAQACSSMWTSTKEEQRQLWQVHTWLLDFQLAGAQGLQGSLTQQQLQQCRAAWDEQLQQSAKQR
jgi:hypothetical protein